MERLTLVLAYACLLLTPACGGDSDSGEDISAQPDSAMEISNAEDAALDLAVAPDEPGNLPPVFDNEPPATAHIYIAYSWQATCSDPEGADTAIGTAEEDTCGGKLTYPGDGSAIYAFKPTDDQEGSNCIVALECFDDVGSAVKTAKIEIVGPADVLEMQYGEFAPWATPIQDFIEYNTEKLGHENFMHDIFDMAVFDGKLYFGYGDANLNLGHDTPIELRYFTAPEPTAIQFDFIVDEEQVSRYRVDGDMFLIPGVDATEDGLMGNAYTMSKGGEWYKSRTLDGGWHVHDIVRIGETIYACGSGGTGDDYQNSTVNAFVWRSTDDGKNFEVMFKLPHPNPPGDHRMVHLASVAGKLYAFGYYSDSTNTLYGTQYTLEGDELVVFDKMPSFFVAETIPLSHDVAMLGGVHIQDPLLQGVMLVTEGGPKPAGMLDGYTLVNAEPLGDGRAVLLYLDGDEYPAPADGPWTVHVGITTNGQDLTELAAFEADIFPVSVAFWHHSLYLGMTDGSLWQAEGAGL